MDVGLLTDHEEVIHMATAVPVNYRGDQQPLRPWEPLATDPWDRDLAAQLRALSERLFDLTRQAMANPPGLATLEGAAWPLGELDDRDDAYVLRLELPGVKRDDVQVDLAGRRLTVRAERKQTQRKGLRRRSRGRSGSFFLETLLPTELDADHVEATLDAGVLTLRLPRPADRRRIKVAVR
jgi:HSP20 family protein